MGNGGQNYIGGSGDMTVNCGITSVGNQAFAKAGTGTLTLKGTNSFGTGQFILGGGGRGHAGDRKRLSSRHRHLQH